MLFFLWMEIKTTFVPAEITEEKFASIDRLIMCSQALYNARMSEMHAKINELEKLATWSILKYFSLRKLVLVHSHKFQCKCDKCGWVLNNNDLSEEERNVCKWQPVFEETLAKHDLTFSPGKVARCIVGRSRIMADKTLQTHLCSGENGDWNIDLETKNIGFGSLFISDPGEVVKYCRWAYKIYGSV